MHKVCDIGVTIYMACSKEKKRCVAKEACKCTMEECNSARRAESKLIVRRSAGGHVPTAAPPATGTAGW